MEIHRLGDAAEVGREAAGIVCSFSFPGAAIALPTGATPIPMYAELGRLVADGTCDLSGATIWAIDEFCGVPPETPGTNASFYRQHLTTLVRELYCPNSADDHPARHIEEYAGAIRATGGLDLAVLGIGTNGHIAFNEPGSARDAPARIVDLEAESRLAHADAFGGSANVPALGMTLGIADVLQARAILVLATGAHKADIVRAALEGPPTADVPASWLQSHERVMWLLDVTAASNLAHA
jgi:glucosamine-6-phosphate deaminase